MKEPIILKGDLCYTRTPDRFETMESGYLVSEDGRCVGVFETLPEKYANVFVQDYGHKLILPGFVDLHLHAPQYPFRGLGMDLELLEWLNQNAFPEESRYGDPDYAETAYQIFTDDLKKSTTTRACLFATIHREATIKLMDLMEETGLMTYVGKVSMDRNSPETLREGTEEAATEVRKWLNEIQGRYERTRPILTPRFIPSCSDGLMEELGRIQKEYDLPVQSHLSENPAEINWVKELCPWSAFYGDAYDRFGLFGGKTKTIMAHCVWSTEEEIERIYQNGVFIAHCPESNMNLSSGIAPIRSYLDRGIKVGLGSDVAGGTSLSLLRAMRQAIQVSKLSWRLEDSNRKPITVPEAFYLGTKGGGKFFGQVGSFEPGYELDAIVLDDSRWETPHSLSVAERVERLIYLDQDPSLTAKYVAGEQISL